MGIKGIITLLALGGIAGAGLYFKDNITDAFASGKDTVSGVKDKLQDGYQGSNGTDTTYVPTNPDEGKGEGGKEGNNSKENNTQFIYVPIYQNNGQQSNQDGQKQNNNKSNPTFEQYVKNDKKKTNRSINNTFTSPWARNNQKDYAKSKYGIDYDTLEKAVGKSESKRTINEKKQIEAAKAREIFDSRSINNW